VLRAQADRQAQMLRAEGEAQAITQVFNAIHAAEPDQALLAYQYMQMLPKLARGDSNKVWIIPSELNDALKGLGQVTNAEEVRDYVSKAAQKFEAPAMVDVQAEIEEQAARDRQRSTETVEQAIADAQALDAGRAASRRAHRASQSISRSQDREERQQLSAPQQPAHEPQPSPTLPADTGEPNPWGPGPETPQA